MSLSARDFLRNPPESLCSLPRVGEASHPRGAFPGSLERGKTAQVHASMSGRVIPLRQQDDAIRVEALILQSVDGPDDLTLGEIDNGDRAVAHAGQIKE